MNVAVFIKYFARILTVFLILPLHECAHAWVAKKMGDDTASLSGRITVNPLAHIDIVGCLLIVLTGFGWAKPVPINPSRMKDSTCRTCLKSSCSICYDGCIADFIWSWCF